MPLNIIELHVCLLIFLCATRADYTEQLLLRPLPALNKVLGRFVFSVDEVSSREAESIFPNVLRQILNKHDVESLHLTFSVGRYADWRYGVAQNLNGSEFTHAPFGTRLQVALRGGLDAQQRWRGITSELGGIFSASLNQMDSTVVTSLEPPFLSAFTTSTVDPSLVFLQGSLAREELCTENLTPWLKMLPCRAFSGLGSLIDPINAVSGEYLSVLLHAKRSTDGSYSLRQHLTTVQRPSKHNIARWSLGSLFLANDLTSTNLTACPLAESSTIHTENTESSEVVITDLRANPVPLSQPWFKDWNEAFKNAAFTSSYRKQQDTVSVHRFITGYGQVRGGIAIQLQNNHPSCDMLLTYLDVIPWYLRLYFHTFKATVSDSGERAQNLIQSFHFVPAELRGRPNQLRIEAFLPANTTLIFSLQMEKTFLRLSEHPPDANRGFDVAPGVALFSIQKNLDRSLACDASTFTSLLYTEPLLVPLPTPDFSMPYNVITMTSTVVAFFVGSMLNTLLRKAPRLKQMMRKSNATD